MSLGLITYQLHFPKDLSADAVQQALLALAGHGQRQPVPVRFVARGQADQVCHYVALPPHHRRLTDWLQRQLPGLVIEPAEAPTPVANFIWQVWQSTGRRPLRTDHEVLTTRAIIVSLLGAGRSEAIELSWLLGPFRRPLAVGNRQPAASERWPGALLGAVFTPPTELDAEARRALRQKLSEPAWRIGGYIGVATTDRPRAIELAVGLLAALRTAEGPGVRLGVRRSSARRTDRLPWRWPMQLNAIELANLLAWPIEEAAADLPVARQTHRRLEGPPDSRRSDDRLLGDSPSGAEIRLSRAASAMTVHLMGPSGTGKSTLLLNLALQDIAAGKSVVVIDPKADLVDAILRRYPLHRLADLVVLDPTDEAPVGLNPLHAPAQPELVADQLLGIFAKLYPDSFGPRTADVLHAGLLTIARWGQGSLAVLPMLLTNPSLRHRIVGAAPDPLGTAPFWAWFERISDAERQQVVAPSMNRLRPFLLRPGLRAVLGQLTPRFQLSDLLTKRRVLLAALPQGTLGPEGSSWLGSLLVNQLWQAIQTRSAVAAEQRHPVCIYIDEFQVATKLPVDFGDLLVQTRALGGAFTLAHQHLAQLDPVVRAAVLSSARSRVLFQLGPDDARVMAANRSEIDADDLMNLPPYEGYVSRLVGNRVQPYISLCTRPAPPESTTPAALIAASRDRYGVKRGDTEAALRALVARGGDSGTLPVGRRPRSSS